MNETDQNGQFFNQQCLQKKTIEGKNTLRLIFCVAVKYFQANQNLSQFV